MKKIFAVLSILFLVEIHLQAQENALLWKVSGGGLKKDSYLFGTIHMICPEDLHFPAAFDTAFRQTEKLYLEIDMDKPGTMLKTMQLSMLTKGSLKELMSTADYTKLDRFMRDSIGMGLALFQRMKPFTLLSVMTARIPDCKKFISVEQKIMEQAKSQKKKIMGLETIEEQFAIFDQIPDTAEVNMILQTIDQYHEQRLAFNKLVDAYKRQDLEGLSIMMNESPDMAGYQDLLLRDRNRKWIGVMKDIMQEGAAFFAVGAGHLAGADGLVPLLRDAGFTIEPLH